MPEAGPADEDAVPMAAAAAAEDKSPDDPPTPPLEDAERSCKGPKISASVGLEMPRGRDARPRPPLGSGAAPALPLVIAAEALLRAAVAGLPTGFTAGGIDAGDADGGVDEDDDEPCKTGEEGATVLAGGVTTAGTDAAASGDDGEDEVRPAPAVAPAIDDDDEDGSAKASCT